MLEQFYIQCYIIPNAFAAFTRSVSFLSLFERALAALCDEVVGAPMACGCFRDWLCFVFTGGLAINSVPDTSSTSSVLLLLMPPPFFGPFSPSFRDSWSLAMIPLTSVMVLLVADIESDASSAAILKVDISEANLCSFVEDFFDWIECVIDRMIVDRSCCLLDSCTQNEFTDWDLQQW